MCYELRTAGDPVAFENTVRQIVHAANPTLPVADMKTQTRYIEATIAPERTFAHLVRLVGSADCMHWLVWNDGLRRRTPHK